MGYIFVCCNMTLIRQKKGENDKRRAISIYFPDIPSDELLSKLLVYAANLALEEGMDIVEECKNIEITE